MKNSLENKANSRILKTQLTKNRNLSSINRKARTFKTYMDGYSAGCIHNAIKLNPIKSHMHTIATM